jgi:tetratricopeptide (TPR) repeat protein
MNGRLAWPLFSVFCIALPSSSHAADPWHLAGWQARAIVEIPTPSTEKGVDTAGVRILCQGRARPDGSDYRVLDAAGKPVPFQIMFHDHERYSLISFRADNSRQKFFVYFGNPQAQRAAEQVVVNPAPGSGAPTGAWVPHFGLVLATIERPEGENPKTVEEMAKLIAGSTRKHGARYQRRVSDGYNSFGPSDYYISIYRGWINIPAAGKYGFCTASNEASFSFLDGKTLVHWPGRHTAERGMFGEVNTEVELTAGLHYLEYYHEEVTLEQMAFLGWKPPGATGYRAIPESVYTAPHTAAVTRYEDPKNPLLIFDPVITDSVWPVERHEGQYTRCRMQPGKTPALPDGTTYRWDFGDGQTATGLDVEHIYLTLGVYPITLTAQGPTGTLTAKWPLQVFELEHVTDQFKEGKPGDYARLAKTYDRTKLNADNLRELAFLFAESEAPAEAIEVGKQFVQRFGDAKPLILARLRRLMADCALRLGKGGIDEAIANYQASIIKETPPAEKINALARLIRLVGIDRNQPDKVAAYLTQVEEAVKESKRGDEEVQPAYRRAIMALGDVRLWQGNREAATQLYGRAEKLSGQFIPSQVKAARVGAYPNSLREYLAGGNYGAALDLVDKWEETFPTDKPNGHTFFWRGKILAMRGQPQDAERYLERSIRLTIGASFETEARWLFAQTLEQLGRKDEAKKELLKLIATGLDDAFTKQAREKLK